jgi:hypothetical protein
LGDLAKEAQKVAKQETKLKKSKSWFNNRL